MFYSWFTDVQLKLISDNEKYHFIESMIRGGISMICKDYSEATNKFLKPYDRSKPSTYIIYMDANNLYRHSMIQLPNEILDWLTPPEVKLGHYCDDGLIGYFLEVDFHYPDELHNLHSGYPLEPKK